MANKHNSAIRIAIFYRKPDRPLGNCAGIDRIGRPYAVNRVLGICMSLRLSAPMLCDDAVDGGPVNEFAPKNHGVDPLNIPNIRQGIGIEQH
jgi:hypothetical protein